jgi:hypothetical protein
VRGVTSHKTPMFSGRREKHSSRRGWASARCLGSEPGWGTDYPDRRSHKSQGSRFLLVHLSFSLCSSEPAARNRKLCSRHKVSARCYLCNLPRVEPGTALIIT